MLIYSERSPYNRYTYIGLNGEKSHITVPLINKLKCSDINEALDKEDGLAAVAVMFRHQEHNFPLFFSDKAHFPHQTGYFPLSTLSLLFF
jgi:hypothetical protein